MILDEDQPGVEDLIQARCFLTEIAPFDRLRPADMVAGDHPPGERPLALASDDRDLAAIYLPVGGKVNFASPLSGTAQWFDPRSGALEEASLVSATSVTAPDGEGANDHPLDWVLLVRNA